MTPYAYSKLPLCLLSSDDKIYSENLAASVGFPSNLVTKNMSGAEFEKKFLQLKTQVAFIK